MNTRFLASGVLFLALASAPTRAADTVMGGTRQEYVTQTWGKADGLPEAPISAVLQAKDAYLWVGTGAGLFRFDGVKFTEFPLRPASKTAVSVTALSEDSHQRLWIGTEQDGLFCLDGGRLTRFGRPEGLLDDGVTSLSIDKEDLLWVGTRHGVNRREGNAFKTLKTQDGLPDDFVSNVHAARSGTVWITTRRGMCSWTKNHLAPFEFSIPGQGRVPEFLGTYEDVRGHLWAFGATYLINLTDGRRFNYFHEDQPASMRIWSLCEGHDGRLWIGTSGGGLFCFEGGKFQPVPLGEARALNDIRALCEDSEGNLWLGVSEGGLTRLRRQRIDRFNGTQGLPLGAATCVTLDAFGRLTVGMERGGIFVEKNHRFEKLADPTGLTERSPVVCLCPALDASLWVSTGGSGLCQIKGGRTARLTSADGLAEDFVSALCRGPDGAIWAGTRVGMLHRINNGDLDSITTAEGLSGAGISFLLPNLDGGVWVATESGEIMRVRDHSVYPVKLGTGFTGKPILSLYEGAAGHLWIGTAGEGLVCMLGRKLQTWNSRDWLPDDFISGIVEDNGANLWLVTGKGIYRIGAQAIATAISTGNPPHIQLIFEGRSAGARNIVAGSQRALRTSDGRLWFATDSGLISLDPQEWLSEEPPPPVRIETIMVNNQSLKITSPIANEPASEGKPRARLPADLRSLEFQFTALNFTAPERIRFRHKLDGFDADWVEAGPDRRVRYGSLPGGRYEFQVTARLANDAWNPAPASFAFVVPTPLYRTPAALVGYGFVLIGGVIGVVRVLSHRRLRRRLARVEQQQAMERERVRIAQDMHDEIGSKLTKISFLSEMAKGEMPKAGPAAAKVDSISETSRELLQSLDEIVWAVNPRNDTVEHLAEYLAQYATEYFQNTSVECDLRLPTELPKLVMSAEIRHNIFLAFEESLNNVLKHSGASRVQIQIVSDPDQFQIRVKDNGHGFPAELQNPERCSGRVSSKSVPGNGLLNMSERLAEVGGVCEISSSVDQGTTVILSLALNALKLRTP